MPKALSKRELGGGRENPVSQLKNGVGTLKNVFGSVIESVSRAANPKRKG